MDRRRKASEEKVCLTCGHAGLAESIATCSQCKAAYEHTYCMNFVRYEVPKDWCCEECLLSAETVSNRNLAAHQFSQKHTSRKIVAGKVKFITNEEVAALTAGKMSHGKGNRSASGYHSDFAYAKPCPSSWKKVTSSLPSSKAVKVPFRPKKGPDYAGVDISASEHTMASEPFKKGQGSLCADDVLMRMVDKHIDNKVPLKPQVDYSFIDEPANSFLAIKGERALHKISDGNVNDSESKAPLEGQDDYLLKDEEPNASLAVMGGRDMHKKRDANMLPINDSVAHHLLNIDDRHAACSIAQCTQILSQKMVSPVKLVISSDEKHHHAVEACWRGDFEVLDYGTQFHGTVNAHLSCQVSPKVYDVSKHLPRTLQFKMLARESVWPKIFKLDPPTKDDVALYFRCEVERHKETYAYFIQHIDLHDYALQGCVADAELLLFTSAQLRIDSQCFNEDIYLWGVFLHVKKKKGGHGEETAASFFPSSPTAHTTHDRSKINSSEVTMEVDKLRGSSLVSEVEMDIDMIGGCSMGRIDVPIKREDDPPRFSKPIQRPPTRFSLKKPTEHPHFFRPPGFPFPAYKRSVPASSGKSTVASSGTTRSYGLADPTGK